MVRQILFNTVEMFLVVFRVLLLARIILSFIRPGYGTFLARINEIATAVTEPVLAPLRRLLPPAAGLDFSPILAFLLIQFVGNLLLGLILRLPPI